MRLDYKNQKPLSTEEVSAEEVQLALKDAKLELSEKELANEKVLLKKKEERKVIMTTYPLDVEAAFKLDNEIESLEEGNKRIAQYKEELGL